MLVVVVSPGHVLCPSLVHPLGHLQLGPTFDLVQATGSHSMTATLTLCRPQIKPNFVLFATKEEEGELGPGFLAIGGHSLRPPQLDETF